MSTETWRVVCEVREVTARHTPGSYGGEWRADSDGAAAGGSSARQAVLALAAGEGWLVAPGETTAAERLAQVTADRDYWREQATGMAPSVDEIRRLTRRVVRGGTGCALDPTLAVDAAIAQADALADADLIMEQRERQITAALTAVAEERAERDAARAEADALRAENTRLATSNAHAADLIVERNHYRERAETHRGRIDWMQSVAAAAMRQGLAECRRLRAELEWARTAVGVTEVQLAGARAIVEGRTVAPTDAEIAAHLAAGGDWLVRKTLDATLIPRTVRWWPLDASGRPTTWPTGGAL